MGWLSVMLSCPWDRGTEFDTSGQRLYSLFSLVDCLKNRWQPMSNQLCEMNPILPGLCVMLRGQAATLAAHPPSQSHPTTTPTLHQYQSAILEPSASGHFPCIPKENQK